MTKFSWQVYDVAGRHQASTLDPEQAVAAARSLGRYGEVRYQGHIVLILVDITLSNDELVARAVTETLAYLTDRQCATAAQRCNKCGGPLVADAAREAGWYQCQDCGVDQADAATVAKLAGRA